MLEGDATAARVDLPLLKAVARARRWSQDLIAGRVQSVSEIARREELDRRSVHRLLRLGFLSPRIVEAIAEGRQPLDLTVIGLSRRIDLPLLWRAQEQARHPLIHIPMTNGAGLLRGSPDSERLQALLNNVRTDSKAVGQLFARIAEQDALVLRPPVEILDPEPQIERSAELQREWCTARNQLWRIGSHRLVCGDSTNKAEVANLWRGARPAPLQTKISRSMFRKPHP